MNDIVLNKNELFMNNSPYYISKIKEYLQKHDISYKEINKFKCIKLVFNLLIHDKVPKENYKNIFD